MEDHQNGVFFIGSSGEYVARLDGNDIGYAPTYAKALRILSNERLARATHQHITYDDLLVMRGAGTFGEYVRSLDAEGMASVAHMLVAANHAAGNMVEYSAVFARLVALRNVTREATAPEYSSPVQMLIVAEYSKIAEQIIIRRGYRGEVLHFCDTWLQAQEYMQSIGAR